MAGCRRRSTSSRPTSSRCSCGGLAAAIIGVARRPVRPARALAAPGPGRARARGRRPRHRHRRHQQPVRSGRHPVQPGLLGRVHGVLDRRDDQQHQLDRRSRRAEHRCRADRVGDAGPDQPHDAGQPAAHRGAVLRAGGRAGSGSCAGTSTRPRSSPARPACSSWATRWPCWRSSGRPRSRSRCSSSACRSSTRSGSSSGALSQRRSPFTPDRSHIHHRLLDLGLSHRNTVLVHLRDLCGARDPVAARPGASTQAYAFISLFIMAGLLLFGPTRGRLRAS